MAHDAPRLTALANHLWLFQPMERRRHLGKGQCPTDTKGQGAGWQKKTPSAAIVDSQSVKTTQIGGPERGFDGGKLIKGRKRHIITDTLGLLLAVLVHAASVPEREGAQRLIERIQSRVCLRDLVVGLELVWADGGYSGAKMVAWVKRTVGWVWEVIKRPEAVKGFVLLPRRWVVERTFAWLSFCRRLSKDYEVKPCCSEAMVYLAMIAITAKRC